MLATLFISTKCEDTSLELTLPRNHRESPKLVKTSPAKWSHFHALCKTVTKDNKMTTAIPSSELERGNESSSFTSTLIKEKWWQESTMDIANGERQTGATWWKLGGVGAPYGVKWKITYLLRYADSSIFSINTGLYTKLQMFRKLYTVAMEYSKRPERSFFV